MTTGTPSQQVNFSSAFPSNEGLFAGSTDPEVIRFNNAQVAGYKISVENSALFLRVSLTFSSRIKKKDAIYNSIKNCKNLVLAAVARWVALDHKLEGRSRFFERH